MARRVLPHPAGRFAATGIMPPARHAEAKQGVRVGDEVEAASDPCAVVD